MVNASTLYVLSDLGDGHDVVLVVAPELSRLGAAGRGIVEAAPRRVRWFYEWIYRDAHAERFRPGDGGRNVAQFRAFLGSGCDHTGAHRDIPHGADRYRSEAGVVHVLDSVLPCGDSAAAEVPPGDEIEADHRIAAEFVNGRVGGGPLRDAESSQYSRPSSRQAAMSKDESSATDSLSVSAP